MLMTVESDSQATAISRALVGKGLVACVNIIPGVRSIFQWEGKVTEEQEFLLLAKTVKSVFSQLTSVVKSLHAYEVPEIIALPIQDGNEEYLTWIQEIVHGRAVGKETAP